MSLDRTLVVGKVEVSADAAISLLRDASEGRQEYGCCCSAVMPLSIVRLVKPVHCENASSPKLVTLPGIVRLVRFVQ